MAEEYKPLKFGCGRYIQAPGAMQGGAAASIFADHAVLGYVVIALLAFCLGTLATVFCFRVKKHKKEQENNDRTI